MADKHHFVRPLLSGLNEWIRNKWFPPASSSTLMNAQAAVGTDANQPMWVHAEAWNLLVNIKPIGSLSKTFILYKTCISLLYVRSFLKSLGFLAKGQHASVISHQPKIMRVTFDSLANWRGRSGSPAAAGAEISARICIHHSWVAVAL